MTTSTFGKLFGGIFAVDPFHSQSSASSSPKAEATPVVVGRGAANERHVMIGGVAMLFRDEGDVVVQFHPAFDFELRETPVGMKLIPSLEPHWAVLREYQGSMREAIAKAIKAAHPGDPVEVAADSVPSAANASPRSSAHRAPVGAPMVIENDVAALQSAVKALPARRPERPRYGVVKEWGEKSFPDGKRPGKTYESFCLTLEHRGEQHVLQGEGLRDAIAESRCRPGDRVEVTRLGKTRVPAVDAQGHPKLDGNGAQILWDKWLWSITVRS